MEFAVSKLREVATRYTAPIPLSEWRRRDETIGSELDQIVSAVERQLGIGCLGCDVAPPIRDLGSGSRRRHLAVRKWAKR